jgi:thiol:disulfide interchange protein
MHRHASRILLSIVITAAGAIVAGSAGADQAKTKPASAAAAASPVWYEGAQGYQQALAEANAYNKPLVVYFYTDWCPYCREFNTKLLNTREVQEHLRNAAIVRINPEKGIEEKMLSRQYRIGGYPSFFLHPKAAENPKPIDRMTSQGDQRRLQTPQEFIATLKQAAGR